MTLQARIFPGLILESLAALNFTMQFLTSAFSILLSPVPSLAKPHPAWGQLGNRFTWKPSLPSPFLGSVPHLMWVCHRTHPTVFWGGLCVSLGPTGFHFPSRRRQRLISVCRSSAWPRAWHLGGVQCMFFKWEIITTANQCDVYKNEQK